MLIVVAAKFWREIIIGFLAFLLLSTLAVLNYKTGQLKEADQKCFTQIQDIERKQVKALTEAQNKVNEVSEDYEKLKSEHRVKVERVTHEVQKIVERPIYLNRCFDDDGLSEINSLIKTSDSS
ncbi:hypothetical protein EAH57_07045 [Acinetobacter sp. 2JN-4]|uniref:hypothetical protein n=1 Tax=Acinetobacter sp. 2JN-4 TaxID=2479844 RepID=UPI000EF9DDA6|nr:hypothetical protein [Acinetobacter sp. 2JN-4]RLZ08776.1 hypothetical protein EAH57_07045 [Acinetobacter sp. 2JN-4]